jgi:4-hydroxybenzoate polyprenyltransferase
MSPYTPPQTPTEPSGRFSPARAALVLILTVAIAANSILMVGPQIVGIVPLALVLGLVRHKSRKR